MKPSTRLLPLIATLLILLASCSTAPSAAPAPTKPATGPNEVEITIESFAYHPVDLTIPVGTIVTWTNKDSVPHTSTSDDALWDSGRLSQGASFTRTFDQAGSFSYHCSVHTSIRGTITVTQ